MESRIYLANNYLRNLENMFINDYNIILKQEKDYWKLRSRVNWLKDGDVNTKFFHIKATNKRRKNNIV